MTRTEKLIETYNRYGAQNYLPLPVVLEKGQGSTVWDVDGKSYLDFLSCYSALNFGHQHPVLVNRLVEQAKKLAVTSRAFHCEELSMFCKELAEFTGLEMVLPMNSGAEAVETAVKIARKWGYDKKGVKGDANIIVFDNNFHGRTITIVSFSTEPDYKAGFGPFTPGFKSVAYNSIEDLEAAIDDKTVGVLIEPIQAEAGILVPEPGYLTAVRKLCTKKNVLLMMDEIQTGLGRTGKDFCYQHEDAKPDLLILGKSLGGGLLPISAVVGRADAITTVRPGQHGSTFGGNPLACAVSRASIELIQNEKLSARSAKIGGMVMEMLEAKPLPGVKEIRGKGALIGIELEERTGGARKYCEKIAERGVLCKETHTYVIRIAPPLTISEADITKGVETIIEVIKA